MTTPQLHYAVRCYNDDGLYGHYTEAGYFEKLCTAFQNLLEVRQMQPLWSSHTPSLSR